jgi:uncharacterized protein (DUF427 family)
VIARAVFNGVVVAESDRAIVVEGNVYFPPDSVNRWLLTPSRSRSLCIWKGVARYYTVTVDGVANRDAAWTYPRPWPLGRRIKDHVAFWNGVSIQTDR